MDIYEKLKELNITLPAAPAKGGIYSPCKEFGKNLVYVSGCGPVIGDQTVVGKLGSEFTLEEGQVHARNAMLNVLAVLDANVGLNNVKGAVKILTFVASADDFCAQPAVANGGSQLLADLFGAENVPARSAIGVNVLPGNIPVETEAIFEIKE
ncbi:RidA family protein [Subdoligranulum variabile]|uniref:RidA family protein n=1 Tax=Subdoligranulum variabile TaxID=214851 RepID=UPI002943657C|nr:RidA family protein [Subdoligranulum variabile]